MKYVILWFRIFYGVHLLYSSLRHYLTTWSVVIPGPGGRFVAALNEVGVYQIVKAIEGVVGLCLVFNLFVPLVLVIEFPISVIIFILGMTSRKNSTIKIVRMTFIIFNAAINGAIEEHRLRIKWRSHAQPMRSLLHPISWPC